MARNGEYSLALLELDNSRKISSQINHPLAVAEIECVEAFVRHETGEFSKAEKLYNSSRSRFTDAEEILPASLVSLDLTILYCEMHRHEETIELAAGIIPVLESLKLYPETLEAIAMLSRAVKSREISESLLRSIRFSIQQDPLTKLL